MNRAGCEPRVIDLGGLRESVEEILDDFILSKARSAGEPDMLALVELLGRFLAAGGKRIRPLMCLIGWHAGCGDGDDTCARHLAASLELLHACALIHDDVMDRSHTRRGQPTVHRTLAECHAARGADPAISQRVGESGAILLGVLSLMWSDELLHAGDPTPHQLHAVLPVIDAMRTELVYGQYLDLVRTGRLEPDVNSALRVIRYKTAKYTVERPLHLGAALAGADPSTLAQCTRYALPVGEAFQLRDDLLGVFGDPALTGKPSLDDLRDGKATVLIALALQRADPDQAALLRALVGNPALDDGEAQQVREVLTLTGARSAVEDMIGQRHRRAVDTLASSTLPRDVIEALRHLADVCTTRCM
jgi:geranylgeranyl diphosphate synthase type I